MRRGGKDTLDGGYNIVRKTVAWNSRDSGEKETGTGEVVEEQMGCAH